MSPSPTPRTPLVLRWVALIGTLASIATLEYLAGEAAGWGPLRSAGVPLGIDAFVMCVLLAPRSGALDRAAALTLMEFTVVVSAVAGHHETVGGKQPNVALGAILATALVFALWRLDETIRADRLHADALTEARTALQAAEEAVTMLRRDLAAAQARLGGEPPKHLAPTPLAPPEAPKAPTKHAKPKTCPTREAARQILLAMDPLDVAKTSNAELGRKHGGSDNWWGQRRGEVLAELEKFNAEAQVL